MHYQEHKYQALNNEPRRYDHFRRYFRDSSDGCTSSMSRKNVFPESSALLTSSIHSQFYAKIKPVENGIYQYEWI